MISVDQAQSIVLQQARTLAAEVHDLTPAVLGQVLAEPVLADLDSPPFPKALMDGYAVIAADLARGPVELEILEEVQAGAEPTQTVSTGKCVRVFTGAPMPSGADSVVIQERCTRLTPRLVRAEDPTLRPGKNCLARGQEMKTGDTVLSPGAALSAVTVGVLANLGRRSAKLYRRPRVAILATGNELVPPDQIPAGGQIRNSNGPMLLAQASRAGAVVRDLGIATDDEPCLKSMIMDGLTSDILMLAGGVSAGKYDLVPEVLENLGVRTHFHHVRMKPGKPMLFGTAGDTLVFGLPGNPVSSFVAFELFVQPAIRKCLGRSDVLITSRTLPLSEPLIARNDRPTWHPARLTDNGVTPLPWFGSADLRGLLNVQGFILLPPGDLNYPPGQPVPVMVIA